MRRGPENPHRAAVMPGPRAQTIDALTRPLPAPLGHSVPFISCGRVIHIAAGSWASRSARSIVAAPLIANSPGANLRYDCRWPVPLHRLDQNWHQRPQPLAAHPGPRSRSTLLARASLYNRRAGWGPDRAAELPGTEQTHRVFAMQATHRGEFIQDAPLAPCGCSQRTVPPTQPPTRLVSPR